MYLSFILIKSLFYPKLFKHTNSAKYMEENKLNVFDRAHIKTGEYLRKKGPKIAGGLTMALGATTATLGTAGLIGTLGAAYVQNKAEQMSGLSFLLGNIFYGFLPKYKQAGLTAYNLVKNQNLLIPATASIAAIAGGYGTYKLGKKLYNTPKTEQKDYKLAA